MSRQGGRIRRACHEPSANEIAGKPKSLYVRSSMPPPGIPRSEKSRDPICILPAIGLEPMPEKCAEATLGPHIRRPKI